MIALIVTQGPARARRSLRSLAERADLLLAADGGARVARAAGLVPHLIIGDFDSLDAKTARWARRRRIPRRRLPVVKDATDAELALREALRRGAREILIFASLTGRMDQALANLLLLVTARSARARAWLTDGRATAWLASGTARIEGRSGDLVSLLPLTPAVRGIVTTGLRYPLRGGTLRRGSTRGISNEITTAPASVRVRGGDVLVIHTPRRAPR
ncbi:MAG TPA: thiamine diphosphokinase [bacterium]|nr:thiamine diphosphokinase [bacterium]